MEILAIIPARGGSKGIPRKNLYPLAGRPMIAYSILAAQASTMIGRAVVSTDDEEIAAFAKSLGAEVRMRPTRLARDDTPTRDVLEHVVNEFAADNYRPDAVLTLQPTSPLRTNRHIDEAVKMFSAAPDADSLVSCIEVPHIFHPRSVMQRNTEGYLEPYFSERQPTRRQDKEVVLARNGAAIYITRTHKLAEFVFGGRLLAFMMDAESSVDVDTLEDMAQAEQMLKARA